MIGSGATLSVKHPCELLEVSRSNDYRSLRPRSVTDRALRDAIAGIYEQHPFYGKRRVQVELSKQGLEAGVRRIRNRMREMHLEPIRPKPRTSVSSRAHEKYPYLLRNRKIVRSDEVWASDITYIPMRRGYVYLTSVIDWHSRKVLSWRLSNSLDSRFCVEALKEALVRYGKPTIFHTDQGSQYTSDSFLDVLRAAEVAISMDGKGRWARQRESRAAVAFGEVRERASARLERSEGGSAGDRALGGVLQPGATASGIGVPNTRRCLLVRPEGMAKCGVKSEKRKFSLPPRG